jgi:hypothetical protein
MCVSSFEMPCRNVSCGQIDQNKQNVAVTFILYGCETWSVTLREERRLRVFENRVLRRIFGPKRDEDKKRMRWAEHVACM